MSFARTTASVAVFVAGCAFFAGCATAPSTKAEKQSLQNEADATLSQMIAQDPGLRDVTHNALAYAVFPSVGKGGMLVGGAYGKGILYEGGMATGFVSLEQASIGAQLGGQSFSELLVLRNPSEVSSLKSGNYSVGAGAGVVVLSAGAAAHTTFDPNASVFVLARGGLMVDVSVSGQRIKYQSFSA